MSAPWAAASTTWLNRSLGPFLHFAQGRQERQVHVRARIAVWDRENVERVNLLFMLVQQGSPGREHLPELFAVHQICAQALKPPYCRPVMAIRPRAEENPDRNLIGLHP